MGVDKESIKSITHTFQLQRATERDTRIHTISDGVESQCVFLGSIQKDLLAVCVILTTM